MQGSVQTLESGQLTTYLERHVAGFEGPVRAVKFGDGQSNPTFRLHAASGDYVLRRKPPGQLLRSAHAVDREYRVLRALRESDVPVPEVYHLCEDDAVVGSAFFIMEYVPGRIFWNPALPELGLPVRRAYYEEMSRVLAAIHRVDVVAAGLEDYGRAGNYYQRQIGRWSKQYRAAETGPIREMDQLMEWLGGNVPDDDGWVSLSHGDYRLDNLIFDPVEPRLVAVLDWELSTLGHPLADLAYQCMQWRLPAVGLLPGLGDGDRGALGLPSEEEYVAAYCRHMGLSSIPHWDFYLAFGFFRFAAILQGVVKRSLGGNASSDRAMQLGELIVPLATMGCEVAGLGIPAAASGRQARKEALPDQRPAAVGSEKVQVHTDTGVCTVTLNRPEVFNALDLETAEALAAALEACQHDDQVRAVVLRGAGSAFCAGGDLAAMGASNDLSATLDEIISAMNRAVDAIRSLPKPVVGAVQGVAAGAGMALALACDLRVVSDKAKFRQAYTSAALVPDSGWSAFAPAVLGPGTALELALLDPVLDAEQAVQVGICSRVVESHQFEGEVATLAGRLARGPTFAFGEVKALVNRVALPDLAGQLDAERRAMVRAGGSRDAETAIRAFLDKRTPVFSGC